MSLLTVRHLTVLSLFGAGGLGGTPHDVPAAGKSRSRLLKSRLEITPAPASLRWLHDVFDNSVAVATFDGDASELRFDSTVTLEHVETALPDYPLEEYAKTYPFRYSDDELPDLGCALAHQYPSDEVRRWVKQFLENSVRDNRDHGLAAVHHARRQERLPLYAPH